MHTIYKQKRSHIPDFSLSTYKDYRNYQNYLSAPGVVARYKSEVLYANAF